MQGAGCWVQGGGVQGTVVGDVPGALSLCAGNVAGNVSGNSTLPRLLAGILTQAKGSRYIPYYWGHYSCHTFVTNL